MGLDLRQESLPGFCDDELLVLTVSDPVQHPQFYEELDVFHRLSVAQISRIEQLRLGGRSRRDAQNISDNVESSSSRQSVLDDFLAKINVLELCSYAEAQFLTADEMDRADPDPAVGGYGQSVAERGSTGISGWGGLNGAQPPGPGDRPGGSARLGRGSPYVERLVDRAVVLRERPPRSFVSHLCELDRDKAPDGLADA